MSRPHIAFCGIMRVVASVTLNRRSKANHCMSGHISIHSEALSGLVIGEASAACLNLLACDWEISFVSYFENKIYVNHTDDNFDSNCNLLDRNNLGVYI